MEGVPWLVGGDFNEIATQTKKKKGNPRPERNLKSFNRCLITVIYKTLVSKVTTSQGVMVGKENSVYGSDETVLWQTRIRKLKCHSGWFLIVELRTHITCQSLYLLGLNKEGNERNFFDLKPCGWIQRSAAILF